MDLIAIIKSKNSGKTLASNHFFHNLKGITVESKKSEKPLIKDCVNEKLKS